jgi:hypothetical protein
MEVRKMNNVTKLNPKKPKKSKKRTRTVSPIDWVDKEQYGCPDRRGNYLCAFADGTIETMTYVGKGDVFWGYRPDPGFRIVYWAEMRPDHHPDYDEDFYR